MVEYILKPEQVKSEIKHVMGILDRYDAPYKGMVVVHASRSPVTEIDEVMPRLIIFSSNEGVEAIAKGEGKKIIGSTMPFLEYFGMPRGYNKNVTLESKVSIVGTD